MRIVIATVQVPFVRGGAEVLAEGLREVLHAQGHEAEIVTMPFKWYPPERILDQVLICRLLDLTESCGTAVDRVIGLKFPAYLIPHPIHLKRDSWVSVMYAEELNSGQEFSHPSEDRPTWDFGPKVCGFSTALCDNGKQSVRQIAQQTGFSKSSVHRLKQAMERRDTHPESWWWETEEGHRWFIRLVVATLYTFGLKRGVGAETISEFFGRLHLETQVGCSPSALRGVMQALEHVILETAAGLGARGDRRGRGATHHRGGGRNLLGAHDAGVHGPGQRLPVVRRGGRGSHL